MGSEKSNEVDESTLARKAAKYGLRCPYRKPTQVDEKKILRRTGEPLLRNSAKLPRNFGRRGATVTGGRSEEAQATVYQKHRSLLSRSRRCIGADACPVSEGYAEMLEAIQSIEAKPR